MKGKLPVVEPDRQMIVLQCHLRQNMGVVGADWDACRYHVATPMVLIFLWYFSTSSSKYENLIQQLH
jgi:hypothetical protein